MIGIDHERRHEPRLSFQRPCKVFDPRGNRYVPGTTCNASRHGLLMRLHRPLPCQPGDRLFLAIPTRRTQGLVRTDEMIEVEVVRALSATSGESAVAVRAERPLTELDLPLPLAA